MDLIFLIENVSQELSLRVLCYSFGSLDDDFLPALSAGEQLRLRLVERHANLFLQIRDRIKLLSDI